MFFSLKPLKLLIYITLFKLFLALAIKWWEFEENQQIFDNFGNLFLTFTFKSFSKKIDKNTELILNLKVHKNEVIKNWNRNNCLHWFSYLNANLFSRCDWTSRTIQIIYCSLLIIALKHNFKHQRLNQQFDYGATQWMAFLSWFKRKHILMF